MCEICGRLDGKHHSRCPYYSPPSPKIICCYCGEGIYQGEYYLDNESGEYIHKDCICNIDTDQLVGLLGFSYKEMEENDE